MNNKTLSDILARMRAGVVPPHQRDEELLAFLADRIEEATKRECGTTAVLREALIAIDDCVWNKHRHTKQETEAHRLATEALSATPRNCDVGTAEEQCLRFWQATEREPEITRSVGGFSRWAQMPYEEGGAE